jgi:hypothetical protein
LHEQRLSDLFQHRRLWPRRQTPLDQTDGDRLDALERFGDAAFVVGERNRDSQCLANQKQPRRVGALELDGAGPFVVRPLWHSSTVAAPHEFVSFRGQNRHVGKIGATVSYDPKGTCRPPTSALLWFGIHRHSWMLRTICPVVPRQLTKEVVPQFGR